MKDNLYDKLLNIKTTKSQQGFHKSFHYHRYEATPYEALETLISQYTFHKHDKIVDFGCGKGRLNFFLHDHCQAAVTGIEMNEEYYQEALVNRDRYLKKHANQKDKIQFYCCLAEEYIMAPEDNRFYFFNPFSLQIFIKVIQNILKSVEMYKREVELILYYPSEEYVYYLENQTVFELKQEIRLKELYPQNENERFLIYQLVQKS